MRIGETVKIPVYGRIPAGSPSEAIEEIEDYIDVPAELVAKNDLLVLRVSGNSMYPKYIEGDYVIIKKQPDCESGQDCAVRVNGCDATLKKVIKERDGIMLQPINPEYAPKKYDYTDEWYSKESMTERGVVQIPLCFLAKSLENMSLCHAAYFCKGWENTRGCRLEHEAAKAYGVEIIYEEQEA